MPIPVIDLFAGPGGLGEGFSALRCDGAPVFKIELSIEKDPLAHKTLELRAFYRQFPDKKAPKEYYDYIVYGEERISRKDLFEKFPDQAKRASVEAWHAELGHKLFPSEEVDQRIRTALGGKADWVLIGGPPCQAYSLMGRAKLIGEFGREKYEEDERHLLYRQYLRILAQHRPPVFVMENVKGLLTAKRKEEHTFRKILEDLQNPLSAIFTGAHPGKTPPLEYRLVSLAVRNGELLGTQEPKDFVVQAENYGIPQARHRLILLGVRIGITKTPRLLLEQPQVSIQKVISDLPRLRSSLSKEPDSPETWRAAILAIGRTSWFNSSKITPEHREEIRHQISNVPFNLDRGGRAMLSYKLLPCAHWDWFCDPRLFGTICNHETRLHIREDLHRYFFASTYARVHGRSPLLKDFPVELLPAHKNVPQALTERKFGDRFRVQIKDHPSTTITSHISKDGHYFIHYDPTQCRSLTVREAARLQTFPDNYFFEGPRTEQYQQVGNAVPPLLAKQIAEIVADLFPS